MSDRATKATEQTEQWSSLKNEQRQREHSMAEKEREREIRLTED